MRDPFGVLGLKEDASRDEVKRRFRELAKTCHPDLNRNLSAREGAARFAELREAAEIALAWNRDKTRGASVRARKEDIEWARTGWSRGGSHGWLRGALEALQANPGRAQAWTVLGCTGAGILLFAVGHYKRLTGEKSMTVAPGFYPTRFTGTEKEREVLQRHYNPELANMLMESRKNAANKRRESERLKAGEMESA